MVKLGVNIDHVATVRQARRTTEPDPVWAAAMAELGGADQITVHLREDRRHIQDRDLRVLAETVNVKLNLECACVDEMLSIACQTKPHQVCLVPEKREEITTEGGLDIIGNRDRVASAISQLHEAGIYVSLFIDADSKHIEASKELGGDAVELHTGTYANAKTEQDQERELAKLIEGAKLAVDCGLRLDAGHGLTYSNVQPIAAISNMAELNIGHSIVARSIFVGFQAAVREMKVLIAESAADRQ